MAKRKPADIELEDESVTGYCVKCKKKNTKMQDPVITWIKTKNSKTWRPMVQGQHKKCGTKMTRFVNQEFVDSIEYDY